MMEYVNGVILFAAVLDSLLAVIYKQEYEYWLLSAIFLVLLYIAVKE